MPAVHHLQTTHSNLRLAVLEHNTGSPATPRNVGVHLARGDYLYFLDSDDWLHREGIERLLGILRETGDDYAVGKTIEVNDKGERVHGRFTCYDELRSIDPFKASGLFRYLGPQARMTRTALVKENRIRYPSLRYAEDKAFFMHVLATARYVSMTMQVIQYLDRTSSKQKSLSQSGNIIFRRKCDLEIIDHIKALNLPAKHEAMMLGRIYEYDFLHMFTTKSFIKSLDKHAFRTRILRSIKQRKPLEALRNPLSARSFLRNLPRHIKRQKISAMISPMSSGRPCIGLL